MTQTLADLQYYFRTLAEQSTDIQQFNIGDAEQVLSLERSKGKYPLLWLETPYISWKWDNNAKRTYDFYFVVLINSKVDDWDYQQYILHRASEITATLIKRMKQDHSDEVIKIVNIGQSMPILGYGHDHDYGYRTSISFEVPLGKCPDYSFVNSCPKGNKLAFTWSNRNPGGFTDLQITDESELNDSLDWEITWRYRIDNSGVVESEDPPQSNLGSGSFILIWVHATDGICEFTASAVFSNGMGCGLSVPTIIKAQWL